VRDLIKFAALFLSALVFASVAAVASAQASETLPGLTLLSEKSASKRAKGIEQLADSGHPSAAAILNAMAEGDLYFRKRDNQLFIVKGLGDAFVLIDPVSLDEVGSASGKELKKVRVNNKLRRLIRGFLGGLNLTHSDAKVRLEAASNLLKNPDPGQRTILMKALEKEGDDSVVRAMSLAIAAIDIRPEAPQEKRIAAVTTLGDSDASEVRALLTPLTGDAENDIEVRQAAIIALDAVEDRLVLYRAIGSVFQGISLGSVLLLAAIGLAITFGVMGVINMAHGEMVMIGAYVTFVIQEAFRSAAPEYFGLSLAVAVPAAFLASGMIGIGLERSVIRWLYGRPLETLLATWGVSLILQQAVRSIFGPTNREVGNPEWMSGAMELAGGVLLTYNRIWIIVFALAVLFGVWALIRFTSIGLEMRAVTQNRRMANAMGIRSARVDALTFGLGSGVAGMAGVALSQIDNVSPNLGQSYIIDSFMVVVFGGVGNLWGTLVGALSLGVVNKFLEPVSGAVLAKIIVLVAIILFIQRRPRGLFALKGRAVEN
jgi:urea transport system permease protein